MQRFDGLDLRRRRIDAAFELDSLEAALVDDFLRLFHDSGDGRCPRNLGETPEKTGERIQLQLGHMNRLLYHTIVVQLSIYRKGEILNRRDPHWAFIREHRHLFG